MGFICGQISEDASQIEHFPNLGDFLKAFLNVAWTQVWTSIVGKYKLPNFYSYLNFIFLSSKSAWIEIDFSVHSCLPWSTFLAIKLTAFFHLPVFASNRFSWYYQSVVWCWCRVTHNWLLSPVYLLFLFFFPAQWRYITAPRGLL